MTRTHSLWILLLMFRRFFLDQKIPWQLLFDHNDIRVIKSTDIFCYVTLHSIRPDNALLVNVSITNAIAICADEHCAVTTYVAFESWSNSPTSNCPPRVFGMLNIAISIDEWNFESCSKINHVIDIGVCVCPPINHYQKGGKFDEWFIVCADQRYINSDCVRIVS